jgi:hypothetical protein
MVELLSLIPLGVKVTSEIIDLIQRCQKENRDPTSDEIASVRVKAGQADVRFDALKNS